MDFFIRLLRQTNNCTCRRKARKDVARHRHTGVSQNLTRVLWFNRTGATIAVRASRDDRWARRLFCTVRNAVQQGPAVPADIDVPRYSLTNYRRCGRAIEVNCRPLPAIRPFPPATDHLF